jgi:hypothetical protein
LSARDFSEPEWVSPKWEEAARRMYNKDGEIEIGYGAKVSMSEEGAYVQAWVWVPLEEVGEITH